MIYIKTFESFDSTYLRNLFSSIDKKSLDNFKLDLEEVCKNIDFPLSSLSDELVFFLPFYKALEIEPDKKFNPKLKHPDVIKFWFDMSGEYLGISTKGERRNVVKARGFSKKISDYELIRRDLDLPEVKNLPHGTIVLAQLERSSEFCIGIVYQSDGSTFIIQDLCDGQSPGDSNYKKYADYSWIIVSRNDYIEINECVEKTPSEIEKVTNAVEDLISSEIILSNNFDIYSLDAKSVLDNASFALVFRLDSAKSLGLSKIQIKKKRKSEKKGALFLTKSKARQINIERYLKTLSQRLDIELGFKNIETVLMRLLGQKYFLFFLSLNYESKSKPIINKLLDTIVNVNVYSSYILNSEIERVKYILEDQYLSNNDLKDSMNKNQVEFNKLKFYVRFSEISELAYQKFKNMKYETVEDSLIALEKIDSLKRIMYKLDKIDFFDILPRMWKTKNWEISYREGYLEANTSTFVFLDSLEKVIRNI